MVITKRLASLSVFLGLILVFGYFSLATVRGASGSDVKNYIWAVPQTCTIPAGQTTCSLTVYWGTNADYPWNSYIYRVIVRENGAVFAQGGPTGSQVAPWVSTTPLHLDLYYASGNNWVNSGMSTELKATESGGSVSPNPSPSQSGNSSNTSSTANLPVGGKFITAAPNPCVLQNNQCSSYITWFTQNLSDVKIMIRENPGSVFAAGASGGQWATWISNSGATFDLYSGSTMIDSVFVKGISASAMNLSSGLVSYWNLDEESGTTAADKNGLNNGVITGTTIVDGKVGKARYFNGSTDRVDLNVSSSLTPALYLTASAWVKATSFPETDSEKKVEVFGKMSTWWLQAQDGYPVIKFINGSSGYRVCKSPTRLALNTWYSLVGVYDFNNLKIYVNGTLANSCPVTAIIPDRGYRAYIGYAATDPTSSWNGIIDEVGIWNRPLSDAEISQLAAGQVPSSQGKVGDFDNDGDVDIYDFNAFVGYFRAHDNRADLDGANGINIQDFNRFVEALHSAR